MNLYDHQKIIIDEDPKYTGLWLGTGSGKTRTTLLLAVGITIVVCPKTQKEDKNWERELDKLDGEHEIKELKVVSKEEFRRDWEELAKEKWNTLIIDEAHTVLGATPNIRYVKRQPIPKTSQLFEAVQAFVAQVKPERLYLVTATIIRSPMTVWAAGILLGKKWDFYKWRDAFYVKLPMPGREVWKVRDDTATKDRLAAAVRQIGHIGRLEDFFDVPDQTYKTIYLDMTSEQKARVKYLPMEYPDPIVLCGKTHQVENGSLTGNEFSYSESFDNAKIDILLELAIEFPRMVIFAKYTAQIEQIEVAMKSKGYKVLILSGATKDRGAVILEANTSSQCIFIAQAQVSAGWQLGKTVEHREYYDYNCMVFASMDYSVVNRIQGEGRILRSDNLKKNLYIDLVMRGGIDEAVYKSIKNKEDFNDRIYGEKLLDKS